MESFFFNNSHYKYPQRYAKTTEINSFDLVNIMRLQGFCNSKHIRNDDYDEIKTSDIQKYTVYLTIILQNRAEYHLILSRRGRRPSWLNQGIFRKIEQDNCFIIQQIPIDYHFQNEKNYGSMIKTLKACNT